MACPSENELLDAIEGRLGGEKREALELHVAGCAICGEVVASGLGSTRTLIELPLQQKGTMLERTSRPRPPLPMQVDALLGSTVGEYVVDSMIGSGGMGIVYRGHHPLIGKPVAVKILRPELAADASHMRRMLTEARAMNAIAHRSIVDVFAFGELGDGRQYMVMEYLQGRPLNQIIREQAPMNAWKLIPLLDGILEALAATHAAGVIHRDLKPSNLYVVEQTDGARFIKLLDFGLAKREVDDQGNTRAGRLVMGTPGYMAPEQIRVEEVSPQTDLYALGVIAYELATAKRPFRGRDSLEVMKEQVESEPTPPSSLVEGLPRGLERLILKLMAKSPGDRPSTAEGVRAELKRIAQGEPSRAVKAPEASGSRKALVIAAAGVIALPLVVGVGWGVSRLGATPAPAPTVSPIADATRVVNVTPVAANPPPSAPPAAIAFAAPPVVATAPPPAPPPRVSARSEKKALLEKAGRLRKRLAKATPAGDDVDPMATMLLNNAERDARAAHSEAELKKVDQTLADIERKYFRP